MQTPNDLRSKPNLEVATVERKKVGQEKDPPWSRSYFFQNK